MKRFLITALFVFSAWCVDAGPSRAEADIAKHQSASARRACLESARALSAKIGPSWKSRDIYWEGGIKAGEVRYVPIFLFKGADCYFVLGTDQIAARSILVPYGLNRLPVSSKSVQGKEATLVHFKAEETGYYLLKVGVRPEEGKDTPSVNFALTYLYH